jgi:hypothetical protein
LPLISRSLDLYTDEKAGVVRATVTSAAALSDAYADKLRAELEKRTGKKVVLVRAVDPTLLGGVVTRIGDQVIDGSLKSRLVTMRDALLALRPSLSFLSRKAPPVRSRGSHAASRRRDQPDHQEEHPELRQGRPRHGDGHGPHGR